MKADSQQTTATTWYSTKTSKHASLFVLQRMDLHHRQVTDDRLLVRLVDIPVHDHFIENVMDLLQIEHDLHVKELLNEKGSGYVQLTLQVKEEDQHPPTWRNTALMSPQTRR